MQVARSSLQQYRQPQHPPLTGGSFRLLSFTVAMARDPLTDEVWMCVSVCTGGGEGGKWSAVKIGGYWCGRRVNDFWTKFGQER